MELNYLDEPTNAAFDILLSGIIPIGYAIFFEPRLSENKKSLIEDIGGFYLGPLLPLFYVFNKITYNQFQKKHFVPIVIYLIGKLFITYLILFERRKIINGKKYFKLLTRPHFKLFTYICIEGFFVHFSPLFILERDEYKNLFKSIFIKPNAMSFLYYFLVLCHYYSHFPIIILKV